MTQINRIQRGLIDRSIPLRFKFNGQEFQGYKGDTLASALIANDQLLIGRSFKYHRPRGIFTSGSEEPNALVQLRSGALDEPNTRATTTELFEGLEARSQNHRGSLTFDIQAVNDLIAPFLSAGFYYKTFMWPKSFWEKVYEPLIRSAAGLGKLSGQADSDIYDKGFLHCDILIIGGGAAGLAVALHAGRDGARIILCDEDFRLGGRLNSEMHEINGDSGCNWAEQALLELKTMDNVRIMSRTTVYGAYDHGIYGALERKTDHLASSNGKPRHVLWRIYTKRAILCSGAIERSIAFGNNDRPGIMLSGAVRSYVNRYAVTPGRNVTIFTNNDTGWLTARDLCEQDITITLIDTRPESTQPFTLPGCHVINQESIINTDGRKRIKSITLLSGKRIQADCLAVSGGWNPNVHISCHLRGQPVWRDDIAAFIPGGILPSGMSACGAAAGEFNLSLIFSNAINTTDEVLTSLELQKTAKENFITNSEPTNISAYWHVTESKKRAWLDLQNDVTTKDVVQSYNEGFRSVEHLKRYTTLGMATDQGKTSNVPALAILAGLTGKSIVETGTTIYRPPYTPVPIGSFAGRSRGKEFRPYRLTPSHIWAKNMGAVFVETGNWLRAQWYPLPGETHWRQSVDREVKSTRTSVGFCDVTTLGKIDIQGKDAGEFLNRIYANNFSTLAIGRIRYGLMLREDGIVYDDGTTARLGSNHYVMTTTTANAVLVFRRMEFAKQCLWPDLDVNLISITDGWAQFSVAGPNSRNLLRKIVDAEFDISRDAFPFMACKEVTVCEGTPARLFRISFSGELAYEIAVPARYGNSMIEALYLEGKEFDAIPYGTEALGVMRIEKGHFAGNELTGQTTAFNLNLDRMISRKKDSIGCILSQREALKNDNAIKLAGFKPVNRSKEFQAGAHFIAQGKPATLANDEGWMTSVAYSPTFEHFIALGFIKNGNKRHGEVVIAADPLRNLNTEVEIVSPHFYDPEGSRPRG